jgi:hypothetical protein
MLSSRLRDNCSAERLREQQHKCSDVFQPFMNCFFSVSTCTEASEGWQCETVTNPSQVNGWLDVFQPPVYKSDGSAFLQILPQEVANDLHYRHIMLHNNNSNENYFISEGQIVVTSILNWDEDTGKVYFLGSVELSKIPRGCVSNNINVPMCFNHRLSIIRRFWGYRIIGFFCENYS